MHRQAKSYQGDLIQWARDIILIGLGSTLVMPKTVSISSHLIKRGSSEIVSLPRRRRHLEENPHCLNQRNVTCYQIKMYYITVGGAVDVEKERGNKSSPVSVPESL